MIVEFLDEVFIDVCNKYSNMDMRVVFFFFLEFLGSFKLFDDNVEIVGRKYLFSFLWYLYLVRVVNINCVIYGKYVFNTVYYNFILGVIFFLIG